jgi:hypothetical protein
MQLATEAHPFRRLCDVHLKPAGADVLTVRSERESQAEIVDAAPHSAEASACEKLQKAAGVVAYSRSRKKRCGVVCSSQGGMP